MKLSFISPVAHLERIDSLGDLSFCLAHVAMTSSIYKSYFSQRARDGHYVMLDNGAYELGSSIPADHMLEMIKEIQPSSAYGPDYTVGDDRVEKTIEDVISFGSYLKRKGFRDRCQNIGCVQGVDLPSWLHCYRTFLNSDEVDIIAIPVMELPDSCFDDVDPKARRATIRLRICRMLKEMNLLHKPIHLTGLDIPYEIWDPLYRHPAFMSNDSKTVIRHARLGIKFGPDKDGNLHWPEGSKQRIEFTDTLTPEQLILTEHNIKEMYRGVTGYYEFTNEKKTKIQKAQGVD